MITKIKTPNHEEWLDIPDFEGKYQISNRGRVKSMNFNREHKECLLKQSDDRDGYKKVVLFKHNRPYYFTVHRLVAKVFIPNPECKPQVDHIDCNRANNNVENLRWATSRENNHYSHKKGNQTIPATPIVATNPLGVTVRTFSQREAAKVSGIPQAEISRFLRGKKSYTRGWLFNYDKQNQG